jgi:hypothetical protein
MCGWIRFELGRPTLGGLLAGALFLAAPAAIPGLVLGSWAYLATVLAGAVVGAFTVRRAFEP